MINLRLRMTSLGMGVEVGRATLTILLQVIINKVDFYLVIVSFFLFLYLIFNVQGGFENTGAHPLHMVGEGTGSKTFKEVNIMMATVMKKIIVRLWR